MHAEESEFTHLCDEVSWEDSLIPPLRNVWCNLVSDELAYGVAKEPLLTREQLVRLEKIDGVEISSLQRFCHISSL
jgi:hypothetical protein